MRFNKCVLCGISGCFVEKHASLYKFKVGKASKVLKLIFSNILSSKMSTSTMPSRPIKAIDSDSPLRKKSFDSETPPEARYFYFRLASESPAESADDTESIYSIQGKETDLVKDTSDTGSKSESEYDIDVEIEYDIASMSGSDVDGNIFNFSDSDPDDMVLAAATLVCDSSLESFITDAEDSDNSMQNDSSSGLMDFWTCIQCKSQNDNPQFRYCDKCYQDRKTFFPPRPRRHKKAKKKKESDKKVKLDMLKSCLSDLPSQDSGVGSSQEFASLCLDQIVVPPHLTTDVEKPSTSVQEDSTTSRKRQFSESSLSEEYEEQRPKKQKTSKKEESKQNGAVVKEESEDKARTTESSEVKGPLPECKDMCIMCNVKPKNSLFLHGRIGHMCCCYMCAMRTWKSVKRCPICNRTASNVVRVFS